MIDSEVERVITVDREMNRRTDELSCPAVAGATPLWCPGAQPTAETVVCGVRTAVEGVRVGYLERAVSASPDLLARVAVAQPSVPRPMTG